MNPWVIGLGVLCGVGLGAATLSLFALWRAHAMVRDVDERARRREEEKHELEERMESLAGRLQELERCPAPPPPVQGHPRPGMNLNKRSQALRLHRQGESSEQIAASLELPRQEVELLLKVHRIVLANV